MDTQLNTGTSSWWKRPEGKVGKVLLWLGGIAAAIGVVIHIGELIILFQNLLYFGFLCGAVFLLTLMFSDKKFRTSLWYLYRSIMRGVTGIFVQLNPIAILESYIEDLNVKMGKINEQLDLLKGQIGKINQKIEDRKAQCAKEFQLAELAQKKGNLPAEVKLHTMQGGRLKEYVIKLQALYNKMTLLYKILDKMRYYSDIMIKNTTFEVQIRKDEYESIRKSHNVMKTAFAIIKGDNDKKLLFDQAMDVVTNDIGTKIGEMERMMEASTEFINSVDLENAAYAENGMKLLETFEQKGLDTIFGTTTDQPAPSSSSPLFDSNAGGEAPVGDIKSNKYSKLMEN